MKHETTTRRIDALINQAIELQQKGDMDAAAELYSRILAEKPDHAEAIQLLGLCRHQQGDNAAAIILLRRAVTLAPDVLQFRNNLGIVEMAAGNYLAASRTFSQSIAAGENSPDMLNAYAVALKSMGDWDNAEMTFAELLRHHPRNIDALFNAANLKLERGHASNAVALYERALANAEDRTDIARNLATALQLSGDLERAEGILSDVLAHTPDDPAALNNLANIYRQTGRLDDAADVLTLATQLDPTLGDAAYNLGTVLASQNETEVAQDWFQRASILNPYLVKAAWSEALTLPQIYRSEDERLRARNAWKKGLHGIIDVDLPKAGEAAIAPYLAAATEMTPFALAYQGGNDRPLMETWGQFIHNVASRAFPQYQDKRRSVSKERVRIGFVSAHWRAHTVARLFSGWMTGLDRNNFEIHMISTSGPGDYLTTELSAHVDRAHIQSSDLPGLVSLIGDLDLDVLIYTDIGMDPRTQVLAALPLARRQFMAWGHPVTSGLPTIDGFLSSDVMEPIDGDDHYSEELIRLPNLSCTFDRPQRPSSAVPQHDFLCAQSLFKIAPVQDMAFADILTETPGTTLTFISHPIKQVTSAFYDRLSEKLRHRGVDPDKRLIFLPPCDRETFLAHLAGARVILDTFEWSGGNTSLEALAMGTPVVTFPGSFMRGRHTMAMLTLINRPDWIARNADDFVAKSVALFSEKQELSPCETDVLFNDASPVRELASILSAPSN